MIRGAYWMHSLGSSGRWSEQSLRYIAWFVILLVEGVLKPLPNLVTDDMQTLAHALDAATPQNLNSKINGWRDGVENI